jgi:hypothetical protein
MPSEYVICVYKPKPGMEKQLQDVLKKHLEVLVAAQLLASPDHLVMKSDTDGSYLEIIEWKSETAARHAHEDPSVTRIWSELGDCAEMVALKDIADAGVTFPHFRRVVL